MGNLGDNYATLAQLKTRLEITTDVHNDRLNAALAAASRGIEKFCNRQFNTASTPSARKFRPLGTTLCHVDDFQSLSSLKTDDSNVGTFSTTWTAADYELEPLNGVVDGEAGWPYWRIVAVYSRWFPCFRRATVEVTALWGWAAVPAPVVDACLIAAEEIFKLKDTPFGIGGYGDFGIVRVRDNPFTARMLNPYRRNPVLVA
jgi:hypothetical protein